MQNTHKNKPHSKQFNRPYTMRQAQKLAFTDDFPSYVNKQELGTEQLSVSQPVEKKKRPNNFPGPGPGRPAGALNTPIMNAKKAIAMFVDGNAHRLVEWLDIVAKGDPKHKIKPNPAKAFELFQSVIEYHVPKLNRSEVSVKVTSAPTQISDADLELIAMGKSTDDVSDAVIKDHAQVLDIKEEKQDGLGNAYIGKD